MNVHATWKHNHAGRVDRPVAIGLFRLLDDTAIRDANVFDDAIDAVGRVVDRPARDTERGLTHLFDMKNNQVGGAGASAPECATVFMKSETNVMSV